MSAVVLLIHLGRARGAWRLELRQLRIHPHGFSKYCIGSALTNPDLRQNRFKIRLRDTEKIRRQQPAPRQ